MNPQFNRRTGTRGIEWTDFTLNITAGCMHGCRWTMPDGTEAICYAESLAEHGVAKRAYPEGFAHHYWRPEKLSALSKERHPSLVFIDSMSDLFGHWVPDEHIRQVLDDVRLAPRHVAQVLTKNAPRLLEYIDVLPENLWVGVSSPPDQMLGHTLSPTQQRKMLSRQLAVLARVLEVRPELVTFMSIEPLSWDFSAQLADSCPLKWAVIGAATNGRNRYQPDAEHVERVLHVLDGHNVPVFFKGNLEWPQWREDFPPLLHFAVLQRHLAARRYGWKLSSYRPNGWSQEKMLDYAEVSNL